MMAASTLTFDEAREAFGPPPPHDPLMKLSAALLPIAEEPNQLQKLEASLITADNLQGDAYAEVLELALDLGLGSEKFDLLRDFFHAAAAYGESRIITRIIANLVDIEGGRQGGDLARRPVAGSA